MSDFQNILSVSLLWIEGFAAIIGFCYFKSLKNSYWHYFIIFLMCIFLFEAFGKWGNFLFEYSKVKFYNYIVIPFQFSFLYWLYAAKSLKNNKLFLSFVAIYFLSFIPSEIFFKESKIVFSFNYTFGCLLLLIVIILEYQKQINSSDILLFYKNKMFYINIGTTLFYIGTLPFYTFYLLLYKVNSEIWEIYFDFSLIVAILMYLLFAASFIWGKQSS